MRSVDMISIPGPGASSPVLRRVTTGMYYQCESVMARKPCYRLADVYYRFGRWFGGKKRADTDADTVEGEPSYEEAMAAYQKAVAEAQAEGVLPPAKHN
ncbi:hypothetical protein E4U53_002089 [Claviceps sorghi]|nr:hypothetical protein E4U53_002089 [Claviceps sorghi]